MKKEEKDLLIKDLCERLPYGVKMLFNNEHKFTLDQMNPRQYSGKDGRGVIFDFGGKVYSIEDCKPYLRPMDSMTEEECDMVEVILGDENIFDFMRNGDIILKEGNFTQVMLSRLYDYFNSIHVDYRGLIPKGLALEAPEGMYSK